jgi:hypothetical protein
MALTQNAFAPSAGRRETLRSRVSTEKQQRDCHSHVKYGDTGAIPRPPCFPEKVRLTSRTHLVSIENDDSITRSQCRGARAILNMTQPDLAQAAHLGLSTVVDFERTRREVSIEAIGALRSALERRGIIFISENGGGPGVRLRDRESPKRIRSKKE